MHTGEEIEFVSTAVGLGYIASLTRKYETKTGKWHPGCLATDAKANLQFALLY